MIRALVPGWEFVDDDGTFVLDSPHWTSTLYLPLVNEAGMMSAVTPTLHGDAKTGQNAFLLAPTSAEDLHTSRAARNFWVDINDEGPWSATGTSAAQVARIGPARDERVTLRAGLLWQTLTRSNHAVGLRAVVTSFVPVTADQAELMKVELTNIGRQPLRLTPTAAIPIYGRSADNLRDHRHVTSLLHRITTQTHGVLVRPTLSFDERGHTANTTTYAVLGAAGDGTPPESFFPVAEDFIGEGGTFDWPAAVLGNIVAPVAAGQTVAGYEAMGGLRFPALTLAPGQTQTYVVLLAILPEGASADDLVATYGSADRCDAALAACRNHWRAKASAVAVRTGDRAYDRWLKWVFIQPTLRRLFGNSFLPYHDYGRGGRGWRDLWQDCLALLLTEPDAVPDLLFSSYAGVRFDGSNATIIGSEPGAFIADRNDIARVWMDHGAWPYLTTRLYLDQSGDLAFLLREQVYFRDQHRDRCTRQDPRWSPDDGTRLRTAAGEVYYGSVLEHLLLQHLTAFFHVGEHNLIRLEGADWNDGLDMAPHRGESAAFTALYAGNLRDLADLLPRLADLGVEAVPLAEEIAPLLDTLGPDPVDYASVDAKQARLAAYFDAVRADISGRQVRIPLADLARDLAAKADWLADHLRRQEWITNAEDFGWFNGYYDDDGARVEGDHPQGVRMTLTGQVFTLLGGIASDEQAREIVRAADRYLYAPGMGGYRLNTDFGEVLLNLGRCFGYAFGHKENGAMFSHMAVMFANALYRRGLPAAGHKALTSISDHCRDFTTSRIYPGIPEYVNPRGRGMYPYLTGSASWLLLTLVTEVFGVRGLLGDLVLAPRLLPEQFDADSAAAISTLFAGRRLAITYHNRDRLAPDAYRVETVTVNGTPVAFDPVGSDALIPRAAVTALDAAGVHAVAVTLGARTT